MSRAGALRSFFYFVLMTYSEKLKDPRWQKKRLEIMDRDFFSCINCNNTKRTLHVHHLGYGKNPWDVDDNMVITLCEKCHENIHEVNSCIDVVNQGLLNCYDFIIKKPVFYTVYLQEIVNNKGVWELNFRHNKDLHNSLIIIHDLREFIRGVDNNINIEVNGSLFELITSI